jgi:hypothetical protein
MACTDGLQEFLFQILGLIGQILKLGVEIGHLILKRFRLLNLYLKSLEKAILLALNKLYARRGGRIEVLDASLQMAVARDLSVLFDPHI